MHSQSLRPTLAQPNPSSKSSHSCPEQSPRWLKTSRLFWSKSLPMSNQFLLPIFFPSQINDQNVKHGEQGESPGMGVSKSIDLIEAESGEDRDSERIGPQFVKPEGSDQQRLHKSVSQKIGRCERLACVGEMLGSVEDVLGNEIVRITGKFMMKKHFYHTPDRGRLDEPEQQAADRFEQAINPLDRNSGAKGLMH